MFSVVKFLRGGMEIAEGSMAECDEGDGGQQSSGLQKTDV